MSQPGELDKWLEIEDFSNETLLAVIERLEASDRPRHWILREAELDDLWRYVEAAIDNERRVDPTSPIAARLTHLFEAVHEAHDLTGEGRMKEAAQQLRDALVRPVDN
jgi:hypothetical protein